MVKKKFKLKVVKIIPEKHPDGVLTYKISLQSKKATYIRGVQASDWDDPDIKRQIQTSFLQEIKKIEETPVLSREEVEAKAKQYEGDEIEEDE